MSRSGSRPDTAAACDAGGVRRVRRRVAGPLALPALLVALVGGLVVGLGVGPAAAATRTVVVVDVAADGLRLAGRPVSTLALATGERVAFRDATALDTFTVTAYDGTTEVYRDTVFPVGDTTSEPYQPAVGRHPVKVRSPLSGAAYAMTVTVAAATPTPGAQRASGQPTADPPVTSAPASGAAADPPRSGRTPAPDRPAAPLATRPPLRPPAESPPAAVAALPSFGGFSPVPPSSVPGAVTSPLLAGPLPRIGTPAPPARETPRLVAGPLEPASGRAVGLPAALAAVLLAGMVTGLVRVVRAEPVDNLGGPVRAV